MERLTEKVFGFVQLKACGNDFCKETCAEHDEEKSCKNCPIQKAFEKLAEYEDFEEIFREKMTDTACEFLRDKEEFKKWLDRNKWIAKKCDEYARAEEQGLLLRLPCKVGDTVYKIINQRDNYDDTVYQIVSATIFELSMIDKIGKTVFLTKAEAEWKLKETESD